MNEQSLTRPNIHARESEDEASSPPEVDEEALSILSRAAKHSLTTSRRYRMSASGVESRYLTAILRVMSRRRLCDHEAVRRELVLHGRNVRRSENEKFDYVSEQTIVADLRQSVTVLENLYRKVTARSFDPELRRLARERLERLSEERRLVAALASLCQPSGGDTREQTVTYDSKSA